MPSAYKYGDKEYTRQQVIEYGRNHYPKLYWIKRGIGIGAIASALLVVILIAALGAMIGKEAGNNVADAFYKDPRMLVYIVSALILIIVGLGLIISSCTRPTDEQCFIHGEKLLKQMESDREYFHKSEEGTREDF